MMRVRAIIEFSKELQIDVCKIDGAKACRWYASGDEAYVTIINENRDFWVVKDHCENDRELTIPKSHGYIAWSKNID
jgi:hypothetical protein